MTILEIQELTRRFGKLTAVDALTIDVEQGEFFGLLGSNGAGKTTVIKNANDALASYVRKRKWSFVAQSLVASG